MAVCVLGSSVPAMAYQKPESFFDNEDGISWEGTDLFLIIPEGEENPFGEKHIDFSYGDEVCIDEDGKVYYNEQADNQERSVCIHSYKAVTSYQHIKKSDGSCKVVGYASQKCTKCGDLIMGEEISTFTYKHCPH